MQIYTFTYTSQRTKLTERSGGDSGMWRATLRLVVWVMPEGGRTAGEKGLRGWKQRRGVQEGGGD